MIYWKDYIKNNIKDIKKLNKDSILCFDIETTSFWVIDNKITTWTNELPDDKYNQVPCGAIPYIWQFGINDIVIYGRELKEFKELTNLIKQYTGKKKLTIWVHNLSYEFVFLENFFSFTKVMARQKRKVMKCETSDEKYIFRCSYFLTNKSLALIGKELNIPKLKGSLDYLTFRTPLTELTNEELKYCEHDILIMQSLIKKEISDYGSIGKIPITSTGKARREYHNLLKENLSKKELEKYHYKVTEMQPHTIYEYTMLKYSYSGGVCGSNKWNTNYIINNIGSWDLTSDYPFQMVVKNNYPISKYIRTTNLIDILTHDFNKDKYTYIFTLEIKNIKSKIQPHFFPSSKIISHEKIKTDQGKLISADKIIISINEIDFECLKMCYDFDKNIKVLTTYKAEKGYLPKEFILFILKLYANKTKLKGIKEKEDLYIKLKNILNSCYGMCVMDPFQPKIEYESGVWSSESDTKSQEKIVLEHIKEMKEKIYNNWLPYSWGVIVTSLAHLQLVKALSTINEDSVYWDTDSCKMRNPQQWKWFFENENKIIISQIKKASKDLNIPLELYAPKNIKGEIKYIGVWDYEGIYTQFITLGAKRYAFKKNDKIDIVISGVPKECACYLKKLEDFKEDFIFPSDIEILTENGKVNVSKLVHHYSDGDTPLVEFPDGYINNDIYYSIALRPTTYKTSLTPELKRYLKDCMLNKVI